MKGNKTPYAVFDGVIFNTRSELRKAREENPSLKGVEYKKEKVYRKTDKSKAHRIKSKRRVVIIDSFNEEGIKRITKRIKGFERFRRNKDKKSWITINAKFLKFKDTDPTKPMEQEIGFKSSPVFRLSDLYKYLKRDKTPEEVLEEFFILQPGEILHFDYTDDGLPTISVSIQDDPIFTSELPK